MKRTLKCVIIFHNMVAQERCYSKCEDNDGICERIVVSPKKPAMWNSLGHFRLAVGITKGRTFTIVSQLELFKRYVSEHDFSKRLLIESLWNHHGDL